MNSARGQNGFALLAVVMLMALMATGLMVWAAQSRNMIRDTRIQTTQAGLDNAIASAAQWAAVNRGKLKKTPILLDMTALQIAGLECQCRKISQKSRRITVEITAISSAPRLSARKTIQVDLY